MSLRNSVPLSLQDADKETKSFIDVLDQGLKTLQGNIDSLKNEFDIVKMQSTSVERWLKAFGWNWDWPGDRRLLLKLVIRIYKWRGTRDGIINILRLFGGPEIELREKWPEAYASGETITDEERIKCTVNLPDELWPYKTVVMQICNFMKPGHAIFEYLHSLIPIQILIEHRKSLFWQVRFLSGFPNSLTKLDQGYRKINGNFHLNGLVTIGPYRKIDSSWMILRKEITHRSRHNFKKTFRHGIYRSIAGYSKHLDTRYKLDGQIRLDYEVKDTRWFLDGKSKIRHEGYLNGDQLLNASWCLNYAHFLDGRITKAPRHFLSGYGDVPVQIEHRQLDGTWSIDKTLAAHCLAWVKWRDGLVIERGLAS